MCTPCKGLYLDAISKPLKGIDPPENALEDWRPSLMDHLRHAEIDIAFKDRHERERLAALTTMKRKPDPRWIEIVDRMCGKL